MFAKSLNRIEALQTYYDGFFHEIESNIRPIVNSCDLAINGDRVSDNLVSIKSTAQYVLRIMDKMARAIRLDLSGMKVNNSTFELWSWFDTFIEDFNAMCRYDEDDEVMFYINPQLKEASMESDPLMLGQVISHLLSNAFKFSEEGTPVKLKCKELNGQLIVEVHNVGTIAAGDKVKLFAPYFRNEEDVPGTGFGLYLCSLYVEALGGTINVQSQNDITVFSITIPGIIHYECSQRA